MSTEEPTQADGAEQPEQDLPVEETEADSVESAEEVEPRKDELAERIADLQRVTAEYHNYRKRVERDRAQLSEQVTASVVTSLLPILDDIDRAREHGDLDGPFASVAEQLNNALVKLGLEAFGDKGDPFDPMVHEAVAHMHSAEVTEPSCIDVMRRGYRLGDRLLRPAMVAVAEPEAPAVVPDDLGAEAEPDGAVEPVDRASDDEPADSPADQEADVEEADVEEADVEEADVEEADVEEADVEAAAVDSDEEDSAESSQSEESEESKDSSDDAKSDAAEEESSGEADNGKSTKGNKK